MKAARFTLISPVCVRIESSQTGRFVDEPSMFAIARGFARPGSPGGPQRPRVVAAHAGAPPFTLQTDRFTLRFTPDGNPFSPDNLRVTVRGCAGAAEAEWRPGAPNRENLGGTIATLDQIRGPVDLGDGLLSRDGWYLLDDSDGPLLVDGWVRARDWDHPDRGTDWFLFAYGDDYRAALRTLADVSGHVPMPRRYALGSWYSRYWPYTSQDFREIVAEYDRHGFPLDVMVLDMDWHREGWTGWSWNRELLPDAEELLAWMHERGLAVTLNLHPADGVGPHEDRYESFMRALGADPGPRQTLPFDAGNRRYMEALFREVIAPLESPTRADPQGRPVGGVDFWWLDWQQDVYVRSVPGLTNLRWQNHLFFQHTASQAGGTRRGLSFSRWAGWGDHRYPVHFSGDSHTGWPMLAFQVPFTSTAGNVGCFYWSHDIGGHFGPRLEETTARWVQFGALSPVLRLHSARRPELDRRPWTYEPRFRGSMRRAFHLRSELTPYLYTAAWGCARDTVPLLRPMYLDSPRQTRAYRVGQQYRLGPDLIAAPIASAGVGERCVSAQEVWFPPESGDGSKAAGLWYNWYTSERHAGGAEAIVAADIDEIPLFARGGVAIPLQPVSMRPTTAPLTTLVLRLWPGEPGATHESLLYEDDGISNAYERGEYAETMTVARWDALPAHPRALRVSLEIGPTVGRFAGQVTRREVRIELCGVGRPLDAAIDGRHTPSSFDPGERGGTLRVDLPTDDVDRARHAEIVFEPADFALLESRERRRRFEAAFGPVAPGAPVRNASAELAGAATTAERRSLVLAIGAGIGLAGDGPDVRLIDSLGAIDGGRADIEIIDRFGPQDTTVDRRGVRLHAWSDAGNGSSGGSATIELPASPPAQPPMGVRSSRIVRARCTVDGRPLSTERVARSILRPLGPWLIAGPFQWEWWRKLGLQVHRPEQKPFDPGDLFEGAGGQVVGWRPGVRGPRWDIDFRVAYPGHHAIAYAVARVISMRPQRSRLIIESSAKVEAWLNGEQVFSLDAEDQPDVIAPSAEVSLAPGPNLLVIKCADGGGGWGFTAALDGPHEVSVEPISPDSAAVPTAG